MKCRLKGISCKNLSIMAHTHTQQPTVHLQSHILYVQHFNLWDITNRSQHAWTEHDSSNSDDKYTGEKEMLNLCPVNIF